MLDGSSPKNQDIKADLLSLIGHSVKYLRKCNIVYLGEKSHDFPKFGKVVSVDGNQISLEDGTTVDTAELISISLLQN